MLQNSVHLTNAPDGTIKLEIENAQPEDSGAYKLVVSNPSGENAALCAVAVKRNYFIFLPISSQSFNFSFIYVQLRPCFQSSLNH